MKKAWTDLKSFVTVALTVCLITILVINIITGKTVEDNLLLLFTNITTAVFTYYFSRKDSDNNEK